MDLIERLNWRYAVKEFDNSKKLTEEELGKVLESLRLSASSFGLQPWKFLVVQNQELKDKLVEHSYHQAQVANCSELIVMCIPTKFGEEDIDRFTNSLIKERGVSPESLDGYVKMMKGFLGYKNEEQIKNWMADQVYLALGSLLSNCAVLGIDTCPMEGFVKPKYDEILGLKEKGLESVVLCPIGFRSPNDKYATTKKVRYESSEVFEFIK